MHFEWDKQKEAANLAKHGVTFAEAETVFLDEHGLLQSDPDHSDDEDRFILLGASTHRLLLVCHCYREEDAIRLISARPANKRERRTYLERNSP